MLRRWHVAVLAVLGVLALACDGAGATPEPTSTGGAKKGYPSSMAALGDSITAGYGSCRVFVACSRNSWSTGGADGLDSHYQRILAKNPRIKGHARNFAVPGARSADLAKQAASAVDAKVQYVTILIGANDACGGGADSMTSVKAFRKRVDAGLDRLRDGLPKARILVASIPDVHRLWELAHDDPAAVRAWKLGICPSMLADPTSDSEAAEARRDRVDDRIDAYNDQLGQACEAYGDRCRWDGGGAHGVRFDIDLLNKVDYFHPSVAGQRRLAEVTYPGRITW
ncbi:SGNH/GDSL hydrolase family protein [Actinoplanes sp. NPDC051494]|uniref:SGNH/GDSL hydrolase family protein n=1 Tax=Actinoplanes sp. NPDC051494 TaxID=3363907 RepID=UPI0037A6377A